MSFNNSSSILHASMVILCSAINMHFLIFIIFSLSVSLILYQFILSLFFSHTTSVSPKLPPGPVYIPIITDLLWLLRPFSELKAYLRSVHAKYGPVVTLRLGPLPLIFVSDRFLAHQALIQNGAVFADRPPGFAIDKILSSNQHNVSSAAYGPTWRLLRRNLTSEIFHPSRVKSYAHARKWVLGILKNRLQSETASSPVRVVDHLQYAMFCLLVLMCFGDKLGEEQVKEIEKVQHELLVSLTRFNVLNFWPRLTKIFLRKRWNEFFRLQKNKKDVLIPLIEARRKMKEERLTKSNKNIDEKSEFTVSYVDTLLDLRLADEKRKLEDKEIISLCSEFLDAGTDTTSTALQWILANLVKTPNIQQKLYEEMKSVVGKTEEEVREEELGKIPYLKAVILEGLRRHPPGHFVLPHAVTEGVDFNGHLIPKNSSVNFLVAEMGRDPKVWEDPMEFKPERFLSGNENWKEMFDLTGSKEIKMMPFGVGRRMCPGYGLAILHLEYFVANLVWSFEWKAGDGDEDGVDLSEKEEFTVVMKNPLQARITPRINK